eukprot:4633064-Pyramimonas_sp.AAC.1
MAPAWPTRAEESKQGNRRWPKNGRDDTPGPQAGSTTAPESPKEAPPERPKPQRVLPSCVTLTVSPLLLYESLRSLHTVPKWTKRAVGTRSTGPLASNSGGSTTHLHRS